MKGRRTFNLDRYLHLRPSRRPRSAGRNISISAAVRSSCSDEPRPLGLGPAYRPSVRSYRATKPGFRSITIRISSSFHHLHLQIQPSIQTFARLPASSRFPQSAPASGSPSHALRCACNRTRNASFGIARAGLASGSALLIHFLFFSPETHLISRTVMQAGCPCIRSMLHSRLL